MSPIPLTALDLEGHQLDDAYGQNYSVIINAQNFIILNGKMKRALLYDQMMKKNKKKTDLKKKKKTECVVKIHSDEDVLPKEKPEEKNNNDEYLT